MAFVFNVADEYFFYEYVVFLVKTVSKLFEPQHEKTCLCNTRTTKAQISNLINTFIVRCLDSIIPIAALSKHSRFLAHLYS